MNVGLNLRPGSVLTQVSALTGHMPTAYVAFVAAGLFLILSFISLCLNYE